MCLSDTNKSTSVESSEGVIIDEEVQSIEILEPTPTVERRRGSDVRNSTTNNFKAKAVAAVDKGDEAIDVAGRLNVSRGQISKWLKMKDEIVHAAVDENKNMFKVTRPDRKYNEQFKALNVKFLDARSKGRRIDFN